MGKLSRLFLNLSIFAVAATVGSPSEAREQVWFETPIAEISVGLDQATNSTIQRAFYLSFVGPFEGVSNPSIARECAELVVKPLKLGLRDSLGAARAKSTPASPIVERTQADLDATSSALLAVTLNIDGKFFNCIESRGAPALLKEGFYLSLVQRDCTIVFCPASKTRRRLANDPDSPIFESLYRWLSVRSAVEQRNITNRHFRLKFSNKGESVILQADFEPICEVNTWPGAISDPSCPDRFRTQAELAGDRVEQFKALILRVRSQKTAAMELVPYDAGLIVGISRNDFLRVSDVVEGASEGFALAPPDLADALADLSNEVARMQILECRYYRGALDVAECSGLPLTPDKLQACLSGEACTPVLPESIRSAALLFGRPRQLEELATSSALPRYLPKDFASLKADIEACTGTPSAAQACVRDKLIGSDAEMAGLLPCFAHVGSIAKASCGIHAFKGSLPPQFDCVERRDQQERAACLLAPTLPAPAQAAYACISKPVVERSNCLLASGGGEVGRLATCRSSNPNNTLLLAACVAGSALPDDLVRGLECLKTGPATTLSVANCALSTQLPPEIAQQVGCITQSRANMAAAGVCVATSNLNLKPNQQLALQCLASTGGEPQSFAICFAGQLTMQEMQNCRGKTFGEGACFGPSNEIQKLAKAITGKAIGPNSVVADMVTVYMKPAQLAFTMMEPVVELATQGLGRAASALKRTLDDVEAASRGDITGMVNLAFAPLVGTLRTFFPKL